jgi:hypothetical protein
MKRNEVAKLMDKIPQGLSPDEFLVALATHAAAWERQQYPKRVWVSLDHIEIGNLWAQHKEVYGFAMALDKLLQDKNR